MVGRYFSVTVGKDLYGQSEGGSCLGMLQGCVEHEVCGRGAMEKSTCFFWWKYDADAGALSLRWARDGCVGKPQVNEHGDTFEKVAGVRAAGCAVVAHLGTGRVMSQTQLHHRA